MQTCFINQGIFKKCKIQAISAKKDFQNRNKSVLICCSASKLFLFNPCHSRRDTIGSPISKTYNLGLNYYLNIYLVHQYQAWWNHKCYFLYIFFSVTLVLAIHTYAFLTQLGFWYVLIRSYALDRYILPTRTYIVHDCIIQGIKPSLAWLTCCISKPLRV